MKGDKRLLQLPTNDLHSIAKNSLDLALRFKKGSPIRSSMLRSMLANVSNSETLQKYLNYSKSGIQYIHASRNKYGKLKLTLSPHKRESVPVHEFSAICEWIKKFCPPKSGSTNSRKGAAHVLLLSWPDFYDEYAKWAAKNDYKIRSYSFFFVLAKRLNVIVIFSIFSQCVKYLGSTKRHKTQRIFMHKVRSSYSH